METKRTESTEKTGNILTIVTPDSEDRCDLPDALNNIPVKEPLILKNGRKIGHKLRVLSEKSRVIVTVTFGDVNRDFDVTYPQAKILCRLGENYTYENNGLELKQLPGYYVFHAAGLIKAGILDRYLDIGKGQTCIAFCVLPPDKEIYRVDKCDESETYKILPLMRKTLSFDLLSIRAIIMNELSRHDVDLHDMRYLWRAVRDDDLDMTIKILMNRREIIRGENGKHKRVG